MKTLKTICTIILVLSFVNCATKEASNLEDARFALDKGNYTEAISKATTALNSNADNIEAARILASAYFGRSGMDFFKLAKAVIDLETDDEKTDLRRIADKLEPTADMDDLRSAIETLESLSGITAAAIDNEDLKDAAFDLGMMQTIEHFALSVYASNYFDTFDPTAITDAQKAIIQADLVAFDDRLIASDVEETETFLTHVRKAICILSPLSAGEGFTTAEYQAWVGCELSSNRDSFDSASISSNIATCLVIHPDQQNASVNNCLNTGEF